MSITVGQAKEQLQNVNGFLGDNDHIKATVEGEFARLDANQDGSLSREEARGLIVNLCATMSLPAPAEADFEHHFNLIDQDSNHRLSVQEVGAAIVGAMQNRKGSIEHFLELAEQRNLGDGEELPHE